MINTPNAQSLLDQSTRSGDLSIPLKNKSLICTACGHRCELKPGKRGVCKVRFNEEGVLRVPFQYTAGLQNDPIEKKPFFHVLPGSDSLSFGMLGCDFKCGYCQNWFTSQTLSDEASTVSFNAITSNEICDVAEKHKVKTIISTYNEPLITSEWAVEVFREARTRNFLTGYVSNGHGTPEVLEYIKPWLDIIKIDLKCFDKNKYRKLGGGLDQVLETIHSVKSMGFWLEIVTLVIPEYNDSNSELTKIAKFIASISPDIPWHVTGFNPQYKMLDKRSTEINHLVRARDIGMSFGLHYVYAGNRPGMIKNAEDTFCPSCKRTLIKRFGFRVLKNYLINGRCPHCFYSIPGVWSKNFLK